MNTLQDIDLNLDHFLCVLTNSGLYTSLMQMLGNLLSIPQMDESG